MSNQFAHGRVSDFETTLAPTIPFLLQRAVKRCNEPDCSVIAAQLFVGRESLVADVYGLKTDRKSENTWKIIYMNGEQWIS